MSDRPLDTPDAHERTSRAFELLAHRRRRAVLALLADREYPPTVADVAKTLAAREHGAPIEAVPERTVRCVYLALVHVHVPKLEADDAVVRDRRRDTVALTERGKSLSAVAEPPAEPVPIPGSN